MDIAQAVKMNSPPPANVFAYGYDSAFSPQTMRAAVTRRSGSGLEGENSGNNALPHDTIMREYRRHSHMQIRGASKLQGRRDDEIDALRTDPDKWSAARDSDGSPGVASTDTIYSMQGYDADRKSRTNAPHQDKLLPKFYCFLRWFVFMFASLIL